MNAVSWANSYSLKNQTNQEQMVEAIRKLSEDGGPLASRSEHAQEKATKSFCELIIYLESTLLYQRDIHPSNLDMVKISMRPDEYKSKYSEVEKIISNEINRQYKNFIKFL